MPARIGGGLYDDADVGDEFYWATVELALASGDERYIGDLSANPWNEREIFLPTGFDRSDLAPFATMQLALAGDPELGEGARERQVSAARRLI